MSGVFTRAPVLQFDHLQASTETLLADERVLAVIGSDLLGDAARCANAGGADAGLADARAFDLGFAVLPAGAPPMRQVLRSRRRVEQVQHQALRGATDGDYLFLSADIATDQPTRAATATAYTQLLAAAPELGFAHLVRIWNCIPNINLGDGDAEQYRQFCVGRFEAFAKLARVPAYPAASALGLRQGVGRIGLLAARFPAAAIENPRQLSAFLYPPLYGPSSPSFSRASLLPTESGDVLLVSGTAAITGHASMHPGDVDAQLRLALANISAVVAAAEGPPDVFSARSGTALTAQRSVDIQLRVYLRHAELQPHAQLGLAACLGVPSSVEWLQADICRRELLVEVEAVLCWGRP